MVSEITGAAALRQKFLATGQLTALSRDELEAGLDSAEHGFDDTEYRGIIEEVETYEKHIFRDELQREYEQAAGGRDNPEPRSFFDSTQSPKPCQVFPRPLKTKVSAGVFFMSSHRVATRCGVSGGKSVTNKEDRTCSPNEKHPIQF